MGSYRQIVDAPCLMQQGEKLLLGLCAAMLPPGATVVEVGTFTGASASILYQAARGTCDLHSLDLGDAVNERVIAKDCFHPFLGDATAFAKDFAGRIDLLFLDGDHSFAGVRADYLTLRPFLAPRAVVVFHDVDWCHLGVKFFCDTLAATGGLRDMVQEGSLLVGTHVPEAALPTVDDFAATLRRQILAYDDRAGLAASRAQAQSAIAVFPPPRDLEKVRFIGRGGFGRLVSRLYDIPWAYFLDSSEADDPECTYYLCTFARAAVERTLVHLRGIAPTRLRVPNPYHLSLALRDELTANAGARLAATAGTDLEKALVPGAFLRLPPELLLLAHETGYLHQFFTRFTFPG